DRAWTDVVPVFGTCPVQPGHDITREGVSVELEDAGRLGCIPLSAGDPEERERRDQDYGREQEASPLRAPCRPQDACCHYLTSPADCNDMAHKQRQLLPRGRRVRSSIGHSPWLAVAPFPRTCLSTGLLHSYPKKRRARLIVGNSWILSYAIRCMKNYGESA